MMILMTRKSIAQFKFYCDCPFFAINREKNFVSAYNLHNFQRELLKRRTIMKNLPFGYLSIAAISARETLID